MPPDVLADSVAGALLGLVEWWLDHGLRDTPEQMEALVQPLMMPGVRAALPERGR